MHRRRRRALSCDAGRLKGVTDEPLEQGPRPDTSVSTRSQRAVKRVNTLPRRPGATLPPLRSCEAQQQAMNPSAALANRVHAQSGGCVVCAAVLHGPVPAIAELVGGPSGGQEEAAPGAALRRRPGAAGAMWPSEARWRFAPRAGGLGRSGPGRPPRVRRVSRAAPAPCARPSRCPSSAQTPPAPP
jgi:hypothetical protein